MPMPLEYQRATDDFRKFLSDAQEIAFLGSPHQTYTMVQGVFQAFRKRLSIKDCVLFANALPVVLRALFIDDWDIDEPKLPFEDIETMTKDAQSLRAPHNFAPDTAIKDVARALRKNLDNTKFDEALSKLPVEAQKFWAG